MSAAISFIGIKFGSTMPQATGSKIRYIRTPGSHAKRGAMAVEFALVGPLFVFLVAVAFDLGLVVFTQSVMDNAVRDAARLIETNQSGSTASAFAAKLCTDMEGLIPCSDLQYYVQAAGSFSAISPAVHTNSSGDLQFNGSFAPGTPGQDVVVQVAYKRPTLIPWTLVYLDGTTSTISKTSNLLVSTVVFQNEP
jgi:Flp pilus assembly protein TadG